MKRKRPFVAETEPSPVSAANQPQPAANPFDAQMRRAYEALIPCPAFVVGPAPFGFAPNTMGGPTRPGFHALNAVMGNQTMDNMVPRSLLTPPGPISPPNISLPWGSDPSWVNVANAVAFFQEGVNRMMIGLRSSAESVNQGLGQLPGIPEGYVPVSGTKEWHPTVTPDFRNHIVHKLVHAVFPSLYPQALLDKQIVTCARDVESDIYEMANSRSEYYRLLGEKMYEIQTEQLQPLEQAVAVGAINLNSPVGIPPHEMLVAGKLSLALAEMSMLDQLPTGQSHGFGIPILPVGLTSVRPSPAAPATAPSRGNKVKLDQAMMESLDLRTEPVGEFNDSQNDSGTKFMKNDIKSEGEENYNSIKEDGAATVKDKAALNSSSDAKLQTSSKSTALTYTAKRGKKVKGQSHGFGIPILPVGLTSVRPSPAAPATAPSRGNKVELDQAMMESLDLRTEPVGEFNDSQNDSGAKFMKNDIKSEGEENYNSIKEDGAATVKDKAALNSSSDAKLQTSSKSTALTYTAKRGKKVKGGNRLPMERQQQGMRQPQGLVPGAGVSQMGEVAPCMQAEAGLRPGGAPDVSSLNTPLAQKQALQQLMTTLRLPPQSPEQQHQIVSNWLSREIKALYEKMGELAPSMQAEAGLKSGGAPDLPPLNTPLAQKQALQQLMTTLRLPPQSPEQQHQIVSNWISREIKALYEKMGDVAPGMQAEAGLRPGGVPDVPSLNTPLAQKQALDQLMTTLRLPPQNPEQQHQILSNWLSREIKALYEKVGEEASGMQTQAGLRSGGAPDEPPLNTPLAEKQVLQQLMTMLRSPQSSEQQHPILSMLKSNQQLMPEFIKQKQQAAAQQMQMQPQLPLQHIPNPNAAVAAQQQQHAASHMPMQGGGMPFLSQPTLTQEQQQWYMHQQLIALHQQQQGGFQQLGACLPAYQGWQPAYRQLQPAYQEGQPHGVYQTEAGGGFDESDQQLYGWPPTPPP